MYTTRHLLGFSLIELMVAISIIGILASIVYANFGAGNAEARDAKRQTDLRVLQTAISQYKQKYERYPVAGCTVGAGNWAHESTCTDYIVGLAPEFIPRLPKDPKRGTAEGFSYVTNANRTVYKAMVMNTVEDDVVSYTHPFKSCDIKPDLSGNLQVCLGGPNCTTVNNVGWCAYVATTPTRGDEPNHCKRAIDNGNANQRFDNSYAVWGGFAAPYTNSVTPASVRDTTAIICK